PDLRRGAPRPRAARGRRDDGRAADQVGPSRPVALRDGLQPLGAGRRTHPALPRHGRPAGRRAPAGTPSGRALQRRIRRASPIAAGKRRGADLTMSGSTMLFLILRLTHVLLAAMWVGMTAFVAFVLFPMLGDMGSGAAPASAALARRKLPVLFGAT